MANQRIQNPVGALFIKVEIIFFVQRLNGLRSTRWWKLGKTQKSPTHRQCSIAIYFRMILAARLSSILTGQLGEANYWDYPRQSISHCFGSLFRRNAPPQKGNGFFRFRNLTLGLRKTCHQNKLSKTADYLLPNSRQPNGRVLENEKESIALLFS